MSIPLFIPAHSGAYEVGHALGVAVRCLGTVSMLFLLLRRFGKTVSS